ncbi:hypothetical protein Mal15_18230 [Stieleria maiorica]|uniref:Cupin domain protein n=1 Tax=Stieleria maiorica TaxID=2795974 RepID=A0A5B9MB74_9BACT|nr:hypothetical protein [Stieleria maiorica]QEF97779.1 hypothetical protein Mal15_18230 [Stieleria maiorica]
MSIPHAAPGVPVNLRTQGDALAGKQSRAFIKTESFEVIRMVVSKGDEVCHNHKVDGPITIQCLDGCINLELDGSRHAVLADQWTYVPAGLRHTISGVEDSVVLLTFIFSQELQ